MSAMEEDRKNGSPTSSPRKRTSRSRSPRSPKHRNSRSPSPRRSPVGRPRRSFGSETDKKDSNTLYVGNLPGFWADRELTELFEKVGKVSKATFRRNKEGRGYGFVEFAERADAEDAIKKYTGHVIEGSTITLDFDVGMDKKRRRRPSYGGGYAPYRRSSYGYRRSRSPRRSRSRSPRRSRRSYSRSPRRNKRSYSRSRSRSRSGGRRHSRR